MSQDDTNDSSGIRHRVRRPARGVRRPWDAPSWLEAQPIDPDGAASSQGDGRQSEYPLSPRRASGEWPRAFDGAQPETPEEPQRRRSDDGDEPAAEKPSGDSLMSRSRELAMKYRTPIIGLGMAGIALPLAERMDQQNANRHEQSATGEKLTPEGTVQEATRPTAAADGSQESREDAVGQQWASLNRDKIISAAMEVFKIERNLAESIHDLAAQEGIDPRLGYGLVKTESSFDLKAKSYVGALGLAQLMPRTAAWLRPGTTKADLLKPEVNLQLGFKYLKQLQDKYRGNTKLALLAYNRGPGTVDRILKRGGNPDNGYADKVVGGSEEVRGG